MDNKLYEWFCLVIVYNDDSWEYVSNEHGDNHFINFEQANHERIYLQPDYDELIVVLKETRQAVSYEQMGI